LLRHGNLAISNPRNDGRQGAEGGDEGAGEARPLIAHYPATNPSLRESSDPDNDRDGIGTTEAISNKPY